ncbi:uncharacterized protein V6R79_024083 [Siganus canaliculatus]
MQSERGEQSKAVKKGKYMGKIKKTPKLWKKFLACGQNKENLLEYFFHHWSTLAKTTIGNTTVIIGHGDKCNSIKLNQNNTDLEIRRVQELEATQEEADTRLMLHAAYAPKYSSDLVIKSPDTDVFVLALGFCNKIDSHLYFQTVKDRTLHTIDIDRLHAHLGEDKCDALVGLHAFTGCDTVSAMHGVGKIKAYKKLISQTEYITLFQQLGTSFSLSPEFCKAVEAFTCDLYDQKCGDVNNARVKLFNSGKCSGRDLPPTKDCLQKHIQRANYQAAVHRRSLECKPDIPAPDIPA